MNGTYDGRGLNTQQWIIDTCAGITCYLLYSSLGSTEAE